MICYKFEYINDTVVQKICVCTNSEIVIAIGNNGDTEATVTLIDDETGEAAGTSMSGLAYYGLFQMTTQGEPAIKNYTATVSGTIDEQAYSHTIKISLNINKTSYASIG